MRKIMLILMVAIAFVACSNESDFDDQSIRLNISELTLKVGDEYLFSLNYNSLTGKKPVCFWGLTGGDKAKTIATVDEDGRIRALQPGETIVRVVSVEMARSFSDPDFTATCKVIILP